MHIENVEIGNFRKLQSVRVDLAEKTTIFVGANNSGKTSAMVALRHFLIDRGNFSINDFTLSNWGKLNELGATWVKQVPGEKDHVFDWGLVLPHLDVWLSVPMKDLHYVQKILPTLDWDGELIGVRLRYEPKDVQTLKQEYLTAKLAADAVISAAQIVEGFGLWPKTMMDFLSLRLRTSFEVRAYLLDPSKLVAPNGGPAQPQSLPSQSEPLDSDPFKKIIQMDEIGAQRGFGFSATSARDENSGDDAKTRTGKRLSSQLRAYYTKHLDPFDQPEPKDLEALQALHGAQEAFSKRLEACFKVALHELEDLGYPGVNDPKLTITTSIKPVDGLNHAAAVQYEVPTHATAGTTAYMHHLPEDSNGLGYQNLVSIVFELMSFRDKWMRVGKASSSSEEEKELVPPIHLVLIEEPEAHLHAQVQQVFIKQAYEVLRKHDKLKDGTDLRTQLIVSTHSSHLAHEAEFTSLRYFRRLPVKTVHGSVPVSTVINLSETFGSENETAQFVRRYLKVTHCDLFFADGAVLVEGPAERLLVPHFVRKREEYADLHRRYVTWLEIGGSHAHRLRMLIEHLGLTTLIVTDIDAQDDAGGKAVPTRGVGLKSGNHTLKTWVPEDDQFDALLDMTTEELVRTDTSGYAVRAAYQQPIQTVFKSTNATEVLANTFEDALIYENISIFAAMKGSGLMGRVRKSLDDAADVTDLAKCLDEALEKGGKAEFAMELLYGNEINSMKIPTYIANGLLWLSDQLKRKEDGISAKRAIASVTEDVASVQT